MVSSKSSKENNINFLKRNNILSQHLSAYIIDHIHVLEMRMKVNVVSENSTMYPTEAGAEDPYVHNLSPP